MQLEGTDGAEVPLNSSQAHYCGSIDSSFDRSMKILFVSVTSYEEKL